jgi:hypothetical protein
VTTRNDNDAELYLLPFQHAIDWAIASLNRTPDQGSLPDEVGSQFLVSIPQHTHRAPARLSNIHTRPRPPKSGKNRFGSVTWVES